MSRLWGLTDGLFGRLHSADARDWGYPMRAATKGGGCLGGRAVVAVTGRTWALGPILDQGDTSQCVAYAWAQWLQTAPIRTEVDTPGDEEVYYDHAQQIDEWDGPPPPYDGTSVRAGAKVMQAHGHLKSYVWATTEPEIWAFVQTTGPVVVGTNWYTAMMRPNSAGYILPAGLVEGGHAYVIYQTNPVTQGYGICNSWGSWGRNGTALLHRADMARLLGEDGEACAGSEVAVA
jgi:hypothetical protein